MKILLSRNYRKHKNYLQFISAYVRIHKDFDKIKAMNVLSRL